MLAPTFHHTPPLNPQFVRRVLAEAIEVMRQQGADGEAIAGAVASVMFPDGWSDTVLTKVVQQMMAAVG
jgi:hypothetical protein